MSGGEGYPSMYMKTGPVFGTIWTPVAALDLRSDVGVHRTEVHYVSPLVA